jgi:uncharacterized protein DUF5677
MPELTPGEFKAQMIERHRASFELWRRSHELLEGAVPLRRDVTPPYARALDILFVQQFKSHGSLYFLCVHGHGEDGATILRRMLEIAFQADYLSNDVPDRDRRAMKYLAWFWLQTEVRLKANIPDDQKTWWEEKYKAHKHLILGANGRPFRNWWGDSSIRDLAGQLGLADTYDQDYRFLSQMAHCTSQGVLMERVGNTLEIRTGLLVREILVFGTRYMISVAKQWNDVFGLLEATQLAELAVEAVNFNFDPAQT